MATDPYDDDPDALPEPPLVRRLRLLVTVLTVVLIVGVVTVVGALVIRLAVPDVSAPRMEPTDPSLGDLRLPDVLPIEDGDRVVAIGRGGAGRLILVVEAISGRQSVFILGAEDGIVLERLDLPEPN